MTEELKIALKAAGYTDAEIAREAKYLARVARENEIIRTSREWNYGLHRA